MQLLNQQQSTPLPPHLWAHICNYLDYKEKNKIRHVNRCIKTVIDNALAQEFVLEYPDQENLLHAQEQLTKQHHTIDYIGIKRVITKLFHINFFFNHNQASIDYFKAHHGFNVHICVSNYLGEKPVWSNSQPILPKSMYTKYFHADVYSHKKQGRYILMTLKLTEADFPLQLSVEQNVAIAFQVPSEAKSDIAAYSTTIDHAYPSNKLLRSIEFSIKRLVEKKQIGLKKVDVNVFDVLYGFKE